MNLTEKSFFRTADSNLASVGLLTKKPGHYSVKPPSNKHTRWYRTDDVGSQDSTLQLYKTSTLLSDICKQFDQELHVKRAEFDKHLQEEMVKFLVQYHLLKQDISVH